MLKWIKKLFKKQDIHIYIHVDGDLNVKEKFRDGELAERKQGDCGGNPTYFKSQGPEVKLDPKYMEPGAKLNIDVPEVDFGRED